MKKSLALLLISGAIFISACSQNPESTNGNTSVSLTPADSAILIDDLSPLDGVIMSFHMLNGNRFILGDNKPGLYLFEDHKMVQQYGGIGRGPCEFSEISATDVKDGVLYVLSSKEVKIVEFDINSGECLREYSDKAMSGITHLMKEDSGDSFLALDGSFSGMQADTTTLLFRIYKDQNYQPMELTYGRIDAVPSMINFRSPNLNFAPYKDSYYFYLPQTDSVYNYEPASGEIRSFAHGIDLKLDEIGKVGQDFQKLMDLMSKEVHMIGKVYSSENWIALEYVYENMAENGKQQESLYFYDHDGNFMSKTPAKDLIGFYNGYFIQLKEGSGDPDNPFQLTRLKPDFN